MTGAHMNSNKDEGVSIVLFSVILNALLFILKGTVGLLVYSTALQADAVNSAGDTMSSLAVFFGIKYSLKPHDDDHHYGHGKMEALISLFVGLVIIVTSGLLWRSIIKIIQSGEFLEANIWALVAALIAIVVKIFMYNKTMRVGKRINSIAVQTNAKDHRNDVFATSATAIAILLSILARITGIEILQYSEPVAAAIMSFFIIKTGFEIIASSVKMLMDAAPDQYIVDELKKVAIKCDGVEHLNWLRCRTIGRGLLVDLAVEVDGNISVEQGHDLADNIKRNIQTNSSDVLDVLVHINPHKT
jgi:cation diffusion facilitator family transporter